MKSRIQFFFLVLSCFSFCFSKNKIRVQCIIEKKYERYWEGSFDKLREELKKFKVKFTNKNPNVIFCNDIDLKVLSYNLPIIKLERFDASTLSDRWGAVEHPLVKAIFKNNVLKPIHMLNTEYQAFGRYHFYLMQKFMNISGVVLKKKKYSKEVLNKIYCVPWHCESSSFASKFKKYNEKNINFDVDRSIDVFFAGNIKKTYKNTEEKFYNLHRTKALKTMQNIKDISKVIIGNSPFSFREYMDHLCDSKIVVSPWGWGEWCFRDCEAMACGAVLIKPDTSFVKTFPELYKNDITYVPCKPDFSDLEDKILSILEHYDDYKPMRMQAKKIMQDQTNLKYLARHFYDTLCKVLNV